MEHWAGKGDVQRMGCTSEALRTAEALALNESGRTLCEFCVPYSERSAPLVGKRTGRIKPAEIWRSGR